MWKRTSPRSQMGGVEQGACKIYPMILRHDMETKMYSPYIWTFHNQQSITELTNPFQFCTFLVQAESLDKLKTLRASATKLQVEQLVKSFYIPYMFFITYMWSFQSLYALKFEDLIMKSKDSPNVSSQLYTVFVPMRFLRLLHRRRSLRLTSPTLTPSQEMLGLWGRPRISHPNPR